MPVSILMPALSPTMEKGNLVKWLKSEGDTVKSGDILAEIETDKATMEVEAVDEGVLAKILVAAGTQDVPVNQVIAILTGEGEDASAAPKQGTSPAVVNPPAPLAAPVTAAPPAAPATAPVAAATSGDRVIASPLARRIAKQKGIDLARVTGTGPRGRVIERDLVSLSGGVGMAPRTALPMGVTPTATMVSPPALGMSDETIKKLFAPGSFVEKPHDSMRKIIAKRLVEAKTTIPHFYLSLDCTLDALLKLREELNETAPVLDGKAEFKLSVNDLVIKAHALALKEIKEANVAWTESAILQFNQVDIGIAVSIEGGLITPIIRDASAKSLVTISNEMKSLAAKARSRKLMPPDYQGGSSAISNLGMYGIKNFAAVINPPHATILAVGAGEKRAVVQGDSLGIATQMSVTLSTDHRCVDGALGAELLAAFKRRIEKPLSLVV